MHGGLARADHRHRGEFPAGSEGPGPMQSMTMAEVPCRSASSDASMVPGRLGGLVEAGLDGRRAAIDQAVPELKVRTRERLHAAPPKKMSGGARCSSSCSRRPFRRWRGCAPCRAALVARARQRMRARPPMSAGPAATAMSVALTVEQPKTIASVVSGSRPTPGRGGLRCRFGTHAIRRRGRRPGGRTCGSSSAHRRFARPVDLED